ncbi:MAG: hypothetical protein HRT37_10455 [Alteromonadaceae bacterium]|nr:hypothetical protein [Alteromonadaceae bacterium]
MVNNNQRFKKTKIALAVVLTMGLTACGVDGDEGSVSNTVSQSETTTEVAQNSVGNQQLTGAVTGVVLDTNNVPVVGAKVFLAGVEVTTDGGGVYLFENVAVINVQGADGSADVGSPLLVSIVAENGLSASVTVTPAAQVNNSDDSESTVITSSVHTYIDGFLAQAGTAVIPTITTRTTGYLRDCATGSPLVGGTVVFDFVGLVGEDEDGDLQTVSGTVGSAAFSVMTNDDGMFDVLLPDDSVLNFLVTGYDVTDAAELDNGTTLYTKNEGVDLFLGTTAVCANEFEGAPYVATAPKVVSIDGQMGTAFSEGGLGSTYIYDHDADAATPDASTVHSYALLNDGVVNDFVINFSEAMSADFDLTQARVLVDGDVVADAVVASTDDGASATVTFAEDLAGGSKVDVWFPFWNATDAEDGLYMVGNDDIDYDAVSVTLTGGNASYTHVFFATFEMPTGDGTVVLGPQVTDAVPGADGDTGTSALDVDLAEYSSAFADNIDGVSRASAILSQLNGDSDTATRLIALGDEILGSTLLAGKFQEDLGVVEYDTSGSPGGVVWSPTPEATGGGVAQFEGAAHGDEVTLTPKNGWGDVLSDSTVTVTLQDTIAPTAVLQESYAKGNQLTVSSETYNAEFGAGGEISGVASGEFAIVGTPILFVQPRHLAGQGERGEEFDGLVDDMAGRLSAADETAGAVAADLESTEDLDTTTVHAMYDAAAFTEWEKVSAEIGVAFSENLTAVAAAAPTYSGTAANITGYTVNNDVALNVDDEPSNADLVDFATPDVMSLANDDAGSMLGFEGAYEDSAGNVITEASNANIMMQDAMPPMVVSAKWLGATFVVEFNESVDTNPAVSLTVTDPTDNSLSAGVTLTLNDAARTSATGNEYAMTVPAGLVAIFQDGTNGEFLYDETGDTDEEQHAILNWDMVPDATGNMWSDFTPVGAVPAARWEVSSPRFLAYSDVSEFELASKFLDLDAPTADQVSAFTAIFTFSHAIKTGLEAGVYQDIDLADSSVGTGTANDGNYFEDRADISEFFKLVFADGAELAMPIGTVALFTGDDRIEIDFTAAGLVTLAQPIVVGSTRLVAIDNAAVNGDADSFGGVTSSITGETKILGFIIQ